MYFPESFAYAGEVSAFLAAACWTVTAISFEHAGRKVGSLPVNILRLLIALVLFGIYGWSVRNHVIPMDANLYTWKWMSISGLIGFCLGDLCLFRSFVLIGSRISMLIMSTVPLLTTLIGWWILDEQLGWFAWAGMIVTICGIVIVVGTRRNSQVQHTDNRMMAGILFALGGAVGQAVGLVISKMGMESFDAVAATQIRVIAGAAGFAVIFSLTGQWCTVGIAVRNRIAMKGILLGSVFGPFLGVSFSLLAVQNTQAGIASTIMSIVPVLIIPPAVIIFKEKLTIREIAGSVVAVAGVSILLL